MYSVGTAYLLWVFGVFGVLGVHHFYLKNFKRAGLNMLLIIIIPVITLLIAGTNIIDDMTIGSIIIGCLILCGIMGLFDAFTLHGQVNKANEKTWKDITDRDLEFIILKYAKENSGLVYPLRLALEKRIPIERVQEGLNALVNRTGAELEVNENKEQVYKVYI
jgi:hypothetical protein